MVIDLLPIINKKYSRLFNALEIPQISSNYKKKTQKKLEHLKNILRMYAFNDRTNYGFSLGERTISGEPLKDFLITWNNFRPHEPILYKLS